MDLIKVQFVSQCAAIWSIPARGWR